MTSKSGHLGISIQDDPKKAGNVLDTLPQPLRVPATVAFYMTASLVLVLVNKIVLNNSIKLPISLVFFQTAVCIILIWGLGSMKIVNAPRISIDKCKQLSPLVCGNVIVLCLNTYCLQYVDASVFQIARGGTLPCTILAQYVLNGRTTSPTCIFAAILIVVGFLSGLFEDHPHAEAAYQVRLGFLFGFLSSVGAAVNACYSAKGVEIVEGNTVHLVFYNQTMLIALLFPVWLLSGEVSSLFHVFSNSDEGIPFIRNILITGVFAFLINLAGFLQIKMTSPATHIVSGAARGVLQTLLGIYVLGESVSAIRFAGVVIIIVGSSLYTFAKSNNI